MKHPILVANVRSLSGNHLSAISKWIIMIINQQTGAADMNNYPIPSKV